MKKHQKASKNNNKARDTPRLRDFVRICSCGNRVICQIKNHGHINILTVEANGYLFDIGEISKFSFSKRTYCSVDSLSLNTLTKLGYGQAYLEDKTRNLNQSIAEGLFLKYPRRVWEQVTECKKVRRLLITKSTVAHRVKYINCFKCNKKMEFRLFKELKDG